MKDASDYYFYTKENGKLWQVDLATGDEAPCALEGTLQTMPRTRYSLELAGRITQAVREGASIASLSKLPEYPSASVLYSWARKHPDFGDALNMAREDRAEYYHDKVLEAVEELVDKEDVPVTKEKVAAYKWAAEKGNPSRYGKGSSADIAGNVTIIVDTGIHGIKEIKEESCQIEDVITMPSETYSLKDSLLVEGGENLLESTLELQDGLYTTGLNDIQNADSTTEDYSDEHKQDTED